MTTRDPNSSSSSTSSVEDLRPLAARVHAAPYSIQEVNALTGRVLGVGGLPYTVQSASTRGEVHVWDPATQTLLRFDSRETFEHWAYGTPVPSAGHR